MAYVTVRLQVSDYSQLSDYNFADYLMQTTVVNAPITFEEIVMVMISIEIRRAVLLIIVLQQNILQRGERQGDPSSLHIICACC